MKRTSFVPMMEPGEKPSILQDKELQGLCSCCQRVSSCTYPRTSGSPILQCEEFDGNQRVCVVFPSHPRALGEAGTPSPLLRETFQSHLGLCSNCEERTTCTYPKPEGGVWHCEEYR